MKLRDGSAKGYEIKQILYADNTVLMTESREDPQNFVYESEMECEKVMVVRKNHRTSCEKVSVFVGYGGHWEGFGRRVGYLEN